MPKIFSQDDRATIRQRLIDAGRDHFLRYGLRKTNVEELARAAGIAKGTFYSFFESKEDLCLAIYDQEELAIREEGLVLLRSERTPLESMKALLGYSLEFVRSDSLLAKLRESGELMLLARGVGEERLAEHLSEDSTFVEEIIRSLEAKGARISVPVEEAAGVLRAFVMLPMHEEEIGNAVFPQVMERLIDWLAKGLVEGD